MCAVPPFPQTSPESIGHCCFSFTVELSTAYKDAVHLPLPPKADIHNACSTKALQTPPLPPPSGTPSLLLVTTSVAASLSNAVCLLIMVASAAMQQPVFTVYADSNGSICLCYVYTKMLQTYSQHVRVQGAILSESALRLPSTLHHAAAGAVGSNQQVILRT